MHSNGHEEAANAEVCGHDQGQPIIYSVIGRLSGTLTEADGNTITFTDAPFRWRVVGDSASLTSLLGLAPGPVFEVPAIKDTIKIGCLELTPTIETVFAAASVPAPVPFGIAGFSDVTTNQGLAWQSPSLAGYDGISPISRLPVAFDNAGPLPTCGGELTITSASHLLFSAVSH